MISSTARDLPEHRGGSAGCVLRQGFFPVMMEHLPASDDDAIAHRCAWWMRRQIYLGILAHPLRYRAQGPRISDHGDGVQPRRRAWHSAADVRDG
jgi:hypothetical protein